MIILRPAPLACNLDGLVQDRLGTRRLGVGGELVEIAHGDFTHDTSLEIRIAGIQVQNGSGMLRGGAESARAFLLRCFR